MYFKDLSISDPKDLLFGIAPNPINTKRGLQIGGGIVYPELNFTLPPIEVSISNQEAIFKQYSDIATGALKRAVELHSNGLILELETVVEMTQYPEIGVGIVTRMNDICEEYFIRHGLKTEIRLTPNDLREFDRPPKMRTSKYLEPMFELFEAGALAGGDLLSIESTGGKEISDDSLMMCDIRQFIFSQAILGVRDMAFIWEKISAIAKKTGTTPGGDTACAFGNTAMVLAEKKYIPKIFAAVARLATIVRSLVAFENGAMGPDKDCGYEGPFIKAITGAPISMEGKSSACAHSSPLGNVAGACADLWSNESVQNIKLLAGMAPTVYLEQLEYDVRLMNTALSQGKENALQLQSLMVNSDIRFDPQAYILAPENVIEISKAIVQSDNHLEATRSACLKGLDILTEAFENDKLLIDEIEQVWFTTIREAVESIPTNEDEFISEMMPVLDLSKLDLSGYGLT
ncbi:MAG: methanol--corrinoid methyltransferase [Bacteroidetes bacterium]|jgi:methanol---5-hydroxybenzimidazolylcobamide Co-methyltransferase|nr:methanol--corrinoid methyltransferase [Bacteroidota bacterium]MBT3748900.1 methanol--corrinoid methyltransferase [Bacteroidota bacterium]MBT4401403.1 methanol--corrinoid methyltransferase [Bacteroidota bacterium]MBT4410659.1 methanol--corrinoid methyltransferase [Bacteroidota bacterium]MBT5424565.1 methanol--corrinoid methyltransferase [Bacteroidota bacterium]